MWREVFPRVTFCVYLRIFTIYCFVKSVLAICFCFSFATRPLHLHFLTNWNLGLACVLFLFLFLFLFCFCFFVSVLFLFLFFSSPAAAFSYKLKLGISLGSKSWTKRETRQTLNVSRTTQCLKWKHSSSPFLKCCLVWKSFLGNIEPTKT